jgi:SAM-dependent methyltransferase
LTEVATPQPGTPEWWDARYQSGPIPWDTGIVPPEVEALLSSARGAPGWALDLGCGSGISTRYLARHGFRVVGIDLAISALRRGQQGAQAEGLAAHFCLGDVADLGYLDLQATLALDVGCLHTLAAERREAYIESLAAHLTAGAFYLLYAFEPAATAQEGPAGLGLGEIAQFAPLFRLLWAQHGHDRGRPSAWYLMQRA